MDSMSKKERLMVAKENLRQASEDLTKQLELVYRKAKELVAKKSLASAWIKDGMTQIKLTAKGKTLKVRSMQDLERVMSEAQMETAKDSAAKGPDQQTAKATDSKDKPIAIDRTQLTFDSPDVIKARGSAVIKVMRVNPRPGHFLKSYIDVRSLPKRPQPMPGSAAALAIGQPHLDVKNANFEFNPYYARVSVPFLLVGGSEKDKKEKKKDPCGIEEVEEGQGDAGADYDSDEELGLPDGDKRLGWYGYREWARNISPTHDGNIAEHINVLLGLVISMAADPENENFPDVEAYPCVQFLRSVKTPEGDIPYNCKSFIAFIEHTCMKILEES